MSESKIKMIFATAISQDMETMDRKKKIREHLNSAAVEILEFIKEVDHLFDNGWVPGPYIKNQLDLNINLTGTKGCEKEWLFALLTNALKDKSLIEYNQENNLYLYRAKTR